MKKIYFLGLALIVGGLSANAQRTNSYTFGNSEMGDVLEKNSTISTTRPTDQVTERALVSLWSEDFTGAIGMTTANGTWTTGGTNPGYWTIGASPFTGWGAGITAPFLVWNSYSAINGVETAFASTATDGEVVSPLMDLSATTNGAILKIEMDAMYCCNFQEEPYQVAVSNDGGISWSAPIPLVTGIGRNVRVQDVAQPLELFADISGALDVVPVNNNDCMVKFIWEANNADPNGQYNSHYAWLVDNIEIFAVPAYETVLERLWLEDVALAWEFGDVPVSQATGTNMTIQTQFLNLGSSAPTNFSLEFTVYDATMASVYTETTVATLSNGTFGLGMGDTATLVTGLDLGTLAIGQYSVKVATVYPETDEEPLNDTLWRTFNITSNTMSHVDYDQPTTSNVQNSTTRAEVGANFLLYNTEALHGVDLYIENGTAGTEVEIYLYENGTASIDYLIGPFTFDITSSMNGQWNTFNLYQAKYESYSPYTLNAGTVYVPVVGAFAGDDLSYRANGSDSDNSGVFYHDVDGVWYSTGDEPWIALNFDMALAVEGNVDYNFTVGQNYPNPFDNNSVISYTLDEATTVSVVFTDISGKVVKTVNQGNQSAGTYQLDVNSADFAEGVYFYTFTIGDTQVTRKMTVTK